MEGYSMNVPAFELSEWEMIWREGGNLNKSRIIEIIAFNSDSGHSRSALVHAAHTVRQSPRAPKVDVLLGRQGPAGRLPHAQRTVGEGHADDRLVDDVDVLLENDADLREGLHGSGG